jgi:hypothetical protein
VVLRGDARHGLGIVAIALEIELGDAPEDAGEAARRLAFLLAISSVEQDVADFFAVRESNVIFSVYLDEAVLFCGDLGLAEFDRGVGGGDGVLVRGGALDGQIRFGGLGEG